MEFEWVQMEVDGRDELDALLESGPALAEDEFAFDELPVELPLVEEDRVQSRAAFRDMMFDLDEVMDCHDEQFEWDEPVRVEAQAVLVDVDSGAQALVRALRERQEICFALSMTLASRRDTQFDLIAAQGAARACEASWREELALASPTVAQAVVPLVEPWIERLVQTTLDGAALARASSRTAVENDVGPAALELHPVHFAGADLLVVRGEDLRRYLRARAEAHLVSEAGQHGAAEVACKQEVVRAICERQGIKSCNGKNTAPLLKLSVSDKDVSLKAVERERLRTIERVLTAANAPPAGRDNNGQMAREVFVFPCRGAGVAQGPLSSYFDAQAAARIKVLRAWIASLDVCAQLELKLRVLAAC